MSRNDEERVVIGMYGDCYNAPEVTVEWNGDGAGTASLWHPHERRKKLHATTNPTFVQTKFAQTVPQAPRGYDGQGGYYHQDNAMMQLREEDYPLAETADVTPSTTNRKMKIRKKKATSFSAKKATELNPNQGGGGGPRESLAVAHASVIRKVKPKHAAYPRQELPFRGRYPAYQARFGINEWDDRFDSRAMHTVSYKSLAHPNQGNDYNHYLPFIASHNNPRPTAH